MAVSVKRKGPPHRNTGKKYIKAKVIYPKSYLPSSFCTVLTFEIATGNVDVIFGGRAYRFFAVPRYKFIAWWKGLATCYTDDPLYHRWYLYKTPSLGAFFNQQIKGQYVVIRL